MIGQTVSHYRILQRGSSEVHVLDLRTEEVTKLPDSEGLFAPRWSPDGRFIAALGGDSLKLILFDLETGTWEALLEGTFVSYPSWSRDGRHLYFDQPRGDLPGIVRVRIVDGSVERMVSLEGFPHTGYLSTWFGLAPDDSPLPLRNTGSDEIYALDWEVP